MIKKGNALKPNHRSKGKPWLFLGLTLGLTWLLEFLAVGLQQTSSAWLVSVLRYLAGAMPLILSMALLYTLHGPDYRQDFWQRLVDLRRITPIWWTVILLLVPLKSSVAAVIDLCMGGSGLQLEHLSYLKDQPLMLGPMLIFWLIFGPVPEELGWRGYALERLETGHNAFFSSMSVGIVWMLWHLPLFFIQETWQARVVGLGTSQFWLYMGAILLDSVIYTWIVNNTQQSILAAILFHFITNSFGELFALSPRAEVINFSLLILIVIIVLFVWGPEKLKRKKSKRST